MSSYKTDYCFLSPFSFAVDRLGLNDGTANGIVTKILDNRKTQNNRSGNGQNQGGRVDTARSATACQRPCQKMHLALQKFMLDSETTSHMTANDDQVHSVTERDVQIHLTDENKVYTREQNTKSVRGLTDQVYRELNLSKTLIALHLSRSLLLVRALNRKDSVVLFMLGLAAMFDLKDS